MKKYYLIIVLILLAVSVFAQEFPQYQPYVDDLAGIFNPEQSGMLRGLLQGVEQSTTAEVVVVSVETTAPYVPSEYRTKLFNYWHIGKKDKDNGLLIVYSVKEHRIEVEVGYGLEGILPDSKVGRLLDDYYVPLRDQGKVQDGIIEFTKAIVNILEENKEEVISEKTNGSNESALGFVIVVVLIFIGFFGLIIYINNKLTKHSKKVSEEIPKSSRGVKGDNVFKFVSPVTSFVIGVVFLIIGYAFLGILIIIFGNLFLWWIRGVRCAKDGLRMKYFRKDGHKYYYKCSNDHIAMVPYYISPGWGGGFIGGGFGGSGGGGGGGGSGGGGAGR